MQRRWAYLSRAAATPCVGRSNGRVTQNRYVIALLRLLFPVHVRLTSYRLEYRPRLSLRGSTSAQPDNRDSQLRDASDSSSHFTNHPHFVSVVALVPYFVFRPARPGRIAHWLPGAVDAEDGKAETHFSSAHLTLACAVVNIGLTFRI